MAEAEDWTGVLTHGNLGPRASLGKMVRAIEMNHHVPSLDASKHASISGFHTHCTMF